MQHPKRRAGAAWLVAILAAAPSADACTPATPQPSLQEKFSRTQRVVVARLTSLTRSPLKGSESFFPHLAVEDATFTVLMTLKGSATKDRKVTTHTQDSGGNCALSIAHPVTVIGTDQKPVENPFSDVWILFLDGRDPYFLHSMSQSMPINLYDEAELRFLLRGRSP